MTRADICVSDDHDTLGRLQAVIAELGGVADDSWHDSPLGTGLTRFRFGDRELTVFLDAWTADVAGPDDVVNAILAALAGQT
ncbi:MAG: hypothetical protein ACRC7O_11820 [Fimbriiglobus sp.]